MVDDGAVFGTFITKAQLRSYTYIVAHVHIITYGTTLSWPPKFQRHYGNLPQCIMINKTSSNASHIPKCRCITWLREAVVGSGTDPPSLLVILEYLSIPKVYLRNTFLPRTCAPKALTKFFRPESVLLETLLVSKIAMNITRPRKCFCP